MGYIPEPFCIAWIRRPIKLRIRIQQILFRKFLAYSASGEFLYVSIFGYIGFVFKDSWVSLYDMIIEFPYIILLILLAIYAFYQLKRYL